MGEITSVLGVLDDDDAIYEHVGGPWLKEEEKMKKAEVRCRIV
jgi:hypothetical protein